MNRSFTSLALAAGLFVATGLGALPRASAQAPPDPVPTVDALPPAPGGEADAAGVEVLARGPLHEAFAQPITFNPEPGRIVKKAPPAAIEEMPADQKPVGDNVDWIPGYWAWDEDRDDFLWVSGFWRVMPPGLAWVPGYWAEVEGGHQWVSGFWTDARAGEVSYLPEPPQSQEAGPSTAPPGPNQFWVPGNWMWNNNSYAWRSGYWSQGYNNWMWSPAHYVWTPRGYIYSNGFWDYNLQNRGLLFAPVYFNQGFGGGMYSPRYALNTGLLTASLFVNPYRRSYFYGDYYGNQYNQFGYQPWFTFGTGRTGYDPLWNSYRQRNGQAWETGIRQNYAMMQKDEKARPGRTYADIQRSSTTNVNVNAKPFVQPLDRIASTSDVKLEKLSKAHLDTIHRNSTQLRDFTKLRSQSEIRADVNANNAAAGANARGKLKLDLPAGITARANTNPRTTLRPNIDGVNPNVNPNLNPNLNPRNPANPNLPGRNPVSRDPGTIQPEVNPNLNPNGPRNLPKVEPKVEPRNLPKVDPKVESPRVINNPPVDNVPKINNPPKAPKIDNPPKAPRIDNPPKAPKVDNPPKAPRINNPPVNNPPKIDNPPKAPRIENPPKAPKIDNPPMINRGGDGNRGGGNRGGGDKKNR